MTATKFPGWLSLPDAAQKYRVRYESLRKLAKAGVFTIAHFGTAPKRPPIFLRVQELDAYRAGGVEAVARVRAKGAA